jgi:hypothetical protein
MTLLEVFNVGPIVVAARSDLFAACYQLNGDTDFTHHTEH